MSKTEYRRAIPDTASWSQKFGYLGELIVIKRLSSLGFDCIHDDDFFGPTDITVFDTVKIEVKTALPSRRRNGQFRLCFSLTTAKDADVVILLGIIEGQFHFWIIPTDELTTTFVEFSDHPNRVRSKWMEYHGDFGAIITTYYKKTTGNEGENGRLLLV